MPATPAVAGRSIGTIMLRMRTCARRRALSPPAAAPRARRETVVGAEMLQYLGERERTSWPWLMTACDVPRLATASAVYQAWFMTDSVHAIGWVAEVGTV